MIEELLRTELVNWSAAGFCLCVCIIVHEYGHLATMRKIYPTATIKWEKNYITIGEDYMWENISKEEKDDVLLNGYMLGFIPLFFLAIILPYYNYVLMTYAFYLLGSWNDIKLMAKKE